jgi:crotonobetainyl-CoA:carnitine CoA-transferase CaiB-like acyl-CoA transferase
VCVAVTDDAEWAAFVAAIGPADGSSNLSADPRFITAADRIANDAALADRLTVLFAERSADEWEQLLTPLDVACVAVSEQSFAQFTIDSPSMAENGFVGEVEHPHFGRHRRHGGIVSFSESALTLGPGNLCGQHTRSIMAELGYSDAEIADLRARNIIGWPDE